ncbi:hypothetical protein CD30_07390 [Ureibacillus massiliensis 4400831 = CIP 108448 = CCUG 49529]|uniref:Fimbrial assembly protein n=1 Tax=Ureibacillus massiliensis 4400831 = CIP 108448 = CCUG 49529 TaxID=1211035 RepID=A0A0A3J6C2_9BACL|nr:PilN domain-containing protein [Ureibacillus massiliensis]KGR91255.1 hypothetical protein CD30_07390 [Ureibacillus massiliensis 4400831 = CIP 108448 = CCUG 49529]
MIPDINLIPKLEKQQTTPLWIYIMVGIISVLALAILSWQYFSAIGAVSSLESEKEILQQQRDQLQAKLTELNSTQQGSIEETIEYVDMISYPVLPLITEIEALQPNNAYLRQYSFGVESVTITVDFETLNDVSEYVSRLSNSPYFVDIQLSDVTQFDLSNDGTAEGTETENFNVIPRHTSNLTLFIDQIYLATGGVQ